ncbi:PREDICTED: probable disease resistance protein At1g59620 [Ipomoea nil]|uniref:probable disease resistance protein At1g59620 n=1 Tax=Ipomoea nil TaxID=35883 RepID=UPI000901F2C9|nr:PREDICTED: probable disease resistance protein At1g59620 [Ipomoea nil]XP_019157681.1 PREDICTED: probable disease resistance protein At1g59620 [Ipomoea nil]
MGIALPITSVPFFALVKMYIYLSKCRLIYPCLKMLRVLDLSFIKYSQGMPSGIADLIHLKYLALSTIASLYKLRFSKLQNLLTLIVTSWMESFRLKLPCDILGLPQLRHLRVDKRCSQYLPCFVQENLQTLHWLKVASFDQKTNFRIVPNLKELGIYIEGQLAPSYLKTLVYLHQLEKLKFEIGRVERFYLPTGFPPNLKKLTLRYTYLPWKEMDIIGRLAHLEVLKLKDFAFCGSEWEPIEQGFRRLKVLLISRSDLKHWNASSDHFPVLERLVLRYCWELKRVPINFANIGTLKLIVLESCYSSLVISANKIEQNHQKREDRKLQVLDLGAKVGMPINEGSEEESVKLPNNEWSEAESFKLPNNEICDEVNLEFSSYLSHEEERPKALRKKVMNALKKKVMKALRRE